MIFAIAISADCSNTSWPDATIAIALFVVAAACFIVYRLTGGD